MPIRTCPQCGEESNIPSNKVTCCRRKGGNMKLDVSAQKNAEVAAKVAAKTVDGLAFKIRDKLKKSSPSLTELADQFDVAPRRVREAVEWLQRNQYNVTVAEQGEEPRLFLAKGGGPQLDVRINAEKFYDGYRFKFGAVSDTHLGSKYYRADILNALYDNFAKHGISTVFHGGNYIEGERHDRTGLVAHGLQGQIDYFIKHYPQRNGIKTYFVAGDDHEGWYQQDVGIDIGRFTQNEAEKQGRNDLINLGYMEADIAVRTPKGRCVIRLLHAGGGSSYAISYSPQKLVESYEGGEKPAVLLIGHYHKAEYIFYRNVHCIQLGTTKSQDTFMRKKRLAAHLGGWRVEMVMGADGAVREFTQTWIPFFNRGYYEAMALDSADGSVEFVIPNETYNVTR